MVEATSKQPIILPESAEKRRSDEEKRETPASGGGEGKEKQQEEPRRKRRPSGSGFDRRPGRRPLKEYPLTKGDMQALAGIGVLATLCFSGAAAAAGFWINISMAIAMSDKLAPTVSAVWKTYKSLAEIACPVLFFIGCALLWLGNSKISEIIRETTHD